MDRIDIRWGSFSTRRFAEAMAPFFGGAHFRMCPHHWVAVGLFFVLILVYNNSVPGRFNTVYENRRFFDSDGEFITRQFDQGKTFTHNDHLLYHVLGRWLHDRAAGIPFVAPNAVSAHKALSVVSGALGIALLFLFGRYWLGRTFPALVGALWVGGCAGYWFFAATIDTYLPNLCAGILALGLALKCWRDQRVTSYALLGAAMGLAFLFRTDSFLLASLGLVVLGRRERLVARLAACAAAGALVSLVGYAMLSRAFYGVSLADMVPWMMGHLNRPETAKEWGLLTNISWESLRLAFLNQFVYSAILPGLYGTRSLEATRAMSATATGPAILWGYLAFMGVAVVTATVSAWRGLRQQAWPRLVAPALALLWWLPRTLFYAWWDPRDPFLFGVLSLPAWWLLLLACLERDGTPAPEQASWFRRNRAACLVALAAAVIWTHNLLVMILPLRAL